MHTGAGSTVQLHTMLQLRRRSKLFVSTTAIFTITLISFFSSKTLKNTQKLLSTSYFSKPISPFSSFLSRTYATIPRPVPAENSEKHENESKVKELRQKLEEINIDGTPCKIGQRYGLTCPQLSTGSATVSLDVYVRIAVKQPEAVISETSLQLEPLCDELISYFAERRISRETLQRNSVMQRTYSEQNVIAFTYRLDGKIAGCKYRSIDKRFWQMKGAKKIFYGVDDIKDADEIIIVEGEVDKLSMDEVGLCNCVSVPNGAPQTVSNKKRTIEEDTGFHYFWNVKERMDKASRIILATDGDIPGQALAEELSRRVGRDRCWQVRWPKKDKFNFCKDANEVLVNLGADALREVIKNAERYLIQNAN